MIELYLCTLILKEVEFYQTSKELLMIVKQSKKPSLNKLRKKLNLVSGLFCEIVIKLLLVSQTTLKIKILPFSSRESYNPVVYHICLVLCRFTDLNKMRKIRNRRDCQLQI